MTGIVLLDKYNFNDYITTRYPENYEYEGKVAYIPENIDISVELMGKKISTPLFFSPTALQRLFHHEGEIAVGKAAEYFNTFFGISSLATASIKDVGEKLIKSLNSGTYRIIEVKQRG